MNKVKTPKCKFLKLLLLFIGIICLLRTNAQTEIYNTNSIDNKMLRIGMNAGADLPFFHAHKTTQLKYDIGFMAGAFADYYISKIGIGIDFDLLKNGVTSKIPSIIYYNSIPSFTSLRSNSVTRLFLGIGPNYLLFNNKNFELELNTRFGISKIEGGEILQISDNPYKNGYVDIHLMSTGYKDVLVPTGKIQIKARYKVLENFSIHGSLYFLNHLNVSLRKDLTIIPKQELGLFYGESKFSNKGSNNYTLESKSPYVIEHNNSNITPSNTISSLGLSLGATYYFGGNRTPVEKVTDPLFIPETVQKNKVIVLVRDEISQIVIPNADVAILDKNNKIVSTGTTNSFGAIELYGLPSGDYTISGNVYGEKTTVVKIKESDFELSNIIRREILYTNQTFILKGKVININTRQPESNVQVRLTNNSTYNITNNSSNKNGEYGFTLEKNASYKLVGIKDNRLSNIESVSTVGLNRSTTLFVNLELGVENFDCNQGTLLDIKYDFDSSNLGSSSLQELDRLVTYLNDHPNAIVEFSAHTDSRGDKSYNQNLSQTRAKSAVDYIMSQGIARNRIIAKGYGETQLLNQCSDGVYCNEEEHSLNRRTEAKLICN